MLTSEHMSTITQTDDTQKAKRYWLADNKGACSRIARELSLTPRFVLDVFWGFRNSRTGQVEARLADLKAPGFFNQ